MPKKHLLPLLILLFLAACSPREEYDLSFMVFGDPAELAAYETLVDTFHQEHPDIRVQLRHIPAQGDYRRRLATDFSGGAPPDVMLLNYRRFALFADQGGLEPLGGYLDDSPLIAERDFFEPAIASFYYEGQLWCVPQNVSSLVVYYNKALFDAAGIPYPADEWTRDDFVTIARALTVDEDGDGRPEQYGAGIAANLFRLAPFIWQNGGQLVDDAAHPTRLMLDSPEALAAMQWLIDLQTKEGVVPDAAAEAVESSERRFLNGRLALYFNSRRGVPTYRTTAPFDWDVLPLPAGGIPSGILHSDGYCMAARTANKAAAWTFIEFANSVQGQEIVAASGRTVPSLTAVANSSIFLDPAQPPANSRVYVDTVPQLGHVPIIKTWAIIEETTSNEIENAFYGRISVEEAARKAIEQTTPYFVTD